MAVLDDILIKVRHVPPLSPVALRVMRMAGDEDCSLQEVAKVIGTDAALMANILKVVNSAAYAQSTPITSLPMAVTRLGLRMVVGIALGACAPHLYDAPLTGYESLRGDMWQHSLRTAISARELCRFSVVRLNEQLAYTAGLLHDLGKAVISQFLQGSTRELVSWLNDERSPDFLQAERRKLGTDHAEIGHQLGCLWKLPEPFCMTMRYHHAPALAETALKPLVYAVHVGDIVAMMSGMGTGADTLMYPLDKQYGDHIKISAEAFEKLVIRVQDEFDKTVAALNTAANGGST